MKLTEKISRIKSTFELMQFPNWEAIVTQVHPDECTGVSETSIPECKSCTVIKPHTSHEWYRIQFKFSNGTITVVSKGVHLPTWKDVRSDEYGYSEINVK
jgi:hypothetical protein